MGINELLNSEFSSSLTPGRAFLVALLYLISSDGEIHSEEVGNLLSILGAKKGKGVTSLQLINDTVVNWAIAYRSQHSVYEFLDRATPLLSTDQKRLFVLNLIDLALSDNKLEPQEKDLIDKFLTAFDLTWESIDLDFQTLLFKNNRQILFEKPAPRI
jgi:uncharacterized tellurite resistance protein B-like protein